MITNKLKKKTKFFDDYGEACEKVIKVTSIIAIYAAIVVGLSFITLQIPEDILSYICIGVFILLFIYFVIRRIIYLNRLLYLPTTHEEIENLNIHSADEYVDFITEFFLYYCIRDQAFPVIENVIRDEFNTNWDIDNTPYLFLSMMQSFVISFLVLMITIIFYGIYWGTITAPALIYFFAPAIIIPIIHYMLAPFIWKYLGVSRAYRMV